MRTIVRNMSTTKINPIEYLFPNVRREVLGLLLGQPEKCWHLRDIQRKTGLSVTTVRRELYGLVGAGILIRTKDGNRTYYHADKESPIFPELQGLITKTAGHNMLLQQALEPLANTIVTAFIYGSIAAGKADNRSDLDLMVVGTCSFKEVVGILHEIQNKIGREINPSVYPPDEFAEKVKARQHFISTVLREPKIFVIGSEDDLERLAK